MTDSHEPAADDLFAGVWITVADLARRKGITRQSVSERVKRLAADGLLNVRQEGRSKLINLAQYDRAVGDVGDPAKEAGRDTKAADADPSVDPKNSAYRDATTRDRQYSADLKYLELQERLGKLVPLAQIEEAAIRAAEATIKIVDRLPSRSDDLASAVARDGGAGARAVMKEITREMRQAIADAMSILAGAAVPMSLETERANDEQDAAG